MNSPTFNVEKQVCPVNEALENQAFIHRLSLVLYPDQVLRSVCRPVESFDSALRDLADEMLSLMQHHRGIGLAAPQVGLRQRLMVSRIEDHLLVLANLEVKDFGEPRDFVRPSCSKNANTDPAQTGGGEDKTSERYE